MSIYKISELESLAEKYLIDEIRKRNDEPIINVFTLSTLMINIFNENNMEVVGIEEDDLVMIRMTTHLITDKFRRSSNRIESHPDYIHNIKNQMRLIFGRTFDIKIKDKHLQSGKYLEL